MRRCATLGLILLFTSEHSRTWKYSSSDCGVTSRLTASAIPLYRGLRWEVGHKTGKERNCVELSGKQKSRDSRYHWWKGEVAAGQLESLRSWVCFGGCISWRSIETVMSRCGKGCLCKAGAPAECQGCYSRLWRALHAFPRSQAYGTSQFNLGLADIFCMKIKTM